MSKFDRETINVMDEYEKKSAVTRSLKAAYKALGVVSLLTHSAISSSRKLEFSASLQ